MTSNNDDLLRLVRAQRDGRLAQEAQTLAETQKKEVIPPSQAVIEKAREATNNQRTTPLDNPNLFAKFGRGLLGGLEKLAVPGEVGAGLLFQAFDKESRERRNKIQTETPEKGLFDFLSSTRKAYKEKNLPLYADLPLTILADPLTYIPVFGAAKALGKVGKVGSLGQKVDQVLANTADNAYQQVIDPDELINSVINQVDSQKKSKLVEFFDLGPLGFSSKVKGETALLNAEDPIERALMEYAVFDARINSVAEANKRKIGDSMKQWNKFISKEKGSEGIFQNTGTSLDGEIAVNAMEDIFDFRRIGYKEGDNLVDLDEAAQRMGEESWLMLVSKNPNKLVKDLVRTDIAFGKSGALRQPASGEGITLNMIQALAHTQGSFQKIQKFARAAGVDVADAQGLGYLHKRVISGNVNDIRGSVFGKARFGKEEQFEKARKVTKEKLKDNEFKERLTESVGKGDLKYLDDYQELVRLYSQGMYKKINEARLQKKLFNVSQSFDQVGGVKTYVGLESLGEVQKILDKATRRQVGSFRTGRGAAPEVKQFLKFNDKEIADIKKLGFGNLARVLKADDMESYQAFTRAYRGLREVALKEATEQGTDVRTFERKYGQLPDGFRNFFFAGKDAEKLSKRYRALTGLQDDTAFVNLSKGADAIGGTIRTFKTGFDFGFALLQGLPTLARAWIDPSQFAVWGKSVKEGFKAFNSPEAVDNFMSEMRNVIVQGADGKPISMLDDYVINGGELGEYATDIYRGKSSATKFVQTVTRSEKATEGFTRVLSKFERNFQFSADVLRIKGYQSMRQAIYDSADDKVAALRGLATFLNKSTGALNPIEAGIKPSQQALERAFIFFSPRYTRASFSLIADAFTNRGIQSSQARESLLGIAGFGLGFYTTLSAALGQEAELDPRNSRFMTVEINGNRVGFGSFWMSLARTIIKTGDAYLGPEDIRSLQQDDPLVQYAGSRTTPFTRLALDLFQGQDFLGRDFDTGLDYAKHALTALAPISLEGAFLDDNDRPLDEKLVGFGTEAVGLRVRPSNIWERRYESRNTVAQEKFGKLWEDLNQLQRNNLEKEFPILEKYNTDARKLAGERGGNLNEKLEIYYAEQRRIQTEYEEAISDGVAEMELAFFNPRELRNITMKIANNTKRENYKTLNARLEEGGDLEDVQAYFDLQGQSFSQDAQIEDVAYREYISDVIGADWDTPRGYDWYSREEAEEEFKQRWGSEYFGYVKERLKSGQYLPPMLQEYYAAREQYEYFWKASEQAVIEAQPYPEVAAQLRKNWLAATDSERLELEKSNILTNVNSQISRVKRQMRLQDAGIDAFLYRWGYYDNLVNAQNKGYEKFWDTTRPLNVAIYKQGPIDFAAV